MATRDLPGFGDLLRRHRTAAALSQEELAERAGLSVRALSDLERGVHRAPRLETVRLLADALGLGAATSGGFARRGASRRQSRGPWVAAQLASARRLPLPPTRLIGREAEVTALSELLAQHDVRLVTLTGPGGTGKITWRCTRPTSQLPIRTVSSSSISPRSPIPRSSCRPSRPRSACARSPRIVAGIPRSTTSGSAAFPLLDNCEHVLGAASDVAALLTAWNTLCPRYESGVVAHPGRTGNW